MTPLEREATKALGACRYLPGSFAKRWGRTVAKWPDERELTLSQKHRLWEQCWTFRRQLPPDVARMARMLREISKRAMRRSSDGSLPEARRDPGNCGRT